MKFDEFDKNGGRPAETRPTCCGTSKHTGHMGAVEHTPRDHFGFRLPHRKPNEQTSDLIDDLWMYGE